MEADQIISLAVVAVTTLWCGGTFFGLYLAFRENDR